MLTADILAALRRRLADVDPVAFTYQDADLLAALEDARRFLAVRQVAGMSGYALVGQSYDAGAPSDEDAWIMILRACIDLLNANYAGMVRRGEFGIVWRSGLESESSVEASQAYRREIAKVERELQENLLIKRRAVFGTRPQ